MSLESAARLAAFVEAVDPLTPGARCETVDDEELSVLATAINAMLDRVERERRESAKRHFGEQERERRAFAQALHEEVGQLLTAALLQLDQAQAAADGEPFDEAREAVEAALSVVQRLSRELRPLVLDDLGLADALAALAASASRRLLVDVRRRVAAQDLESFAPHEQTIVFGIAHRALSAVLHEGMATMAELIVERDGDAIELRVWSDAPGPVDLTHDQVRSMREAALMVGGQIAFISNRAGQEIALRIPTSMG